MDATLATYLLSFDRLSTALVGITDPPVVLDQLVERLCQGLAIGGASASFASDGGSPWVVGVPEGFAALDRSLQREAGPASSAREDGRIVRAGSWEEARDRWPAWADVARGLGVAAVAALPMSAGDQTLGAVSLYAHRNRRWSEDELAAAQVMAHVATAHLVTIDALQRQRRRSQELQTALDSRVVIEQAKGILANENAVSVDAAFEMLRRHARDHKASLHSVASAVVELGLRPPRTAGSAQADQRRPQRAEPSY